MRLLRFQLGLARGVPLLADGLKKAYVGGEWRLVIIV